MQWALRPFPTGQKYFPRTQGKESQPVAGGRFGVLAVNLFPAQVFSILEILSK